MSRQPVSPAPRPALPCGHTTRCGVEYAGTTEDYDGTSEWRCDTCGRRWGRWSQQELHPNEIEGRYGRGVVRQVNYGALPAAPAPRPAEPPTLAPLLTMTDAEWQLCQTNDTYAANRAGTLVDEIRQLRAEVARVTAERNDARAGLFHRITRWDPDGQQDTKIQDELQLLRDDLATLRARETAPTAFLVYHYVAYEKDDEVCICRTREEAEAVVRRVADYIAAAPPEPSGEETVEEYNRLDDTRHDYLNACPDWSGCYYGAEDGDALSIRELPLAGDGPRHTGGA